MRSGYLKTTSSIMTAPPVDWPDLYSWELDKMVVAVMNHGTVNDGTDVDKGTVFEIAMPFKGFGKIAGSANIPTASR